MVTLKPTATTWVMRDRETQTMRRIAVKDMTSPHLWRWILYFRRKYRDAGFVGSEAQLDAMIRSVIVTAPAIYAEAQQRGVMVLPEPVMDSSLDRALQAFSDRLQEELPLTFRRVSSVTYAFVPQLTVNVRMHEAKHLPYAEEVRPDLQRMADEAFGAGAVVKIWGPEPLRATMKATIGAVAVSESAEPGVRRITLADEGE